MYVGFVYFTNFLYLKRIQEENKQTFGTSKQNRSENTLTVQFKSLETLPMFIAKI